jgi:ADP-ribosylglycohydrolase
MVHTLVGLAIGDALGTPFETQHFTSGILSAWSGEYLGSSYHGTHPGEGTDDTLMALALAEVLATRGEYIPEEAAERYVRIWQQYPTRGWGKSTVSALEKLMRGRSWTASGSPSEGNGTAMRAAPIGLRYGSEEAGGWARTDAAITHDTIEAREGSAAIATAVALLREGVEPPDVVPRVLASLVPCGVRHQIEETLQPWDSTFQMLITVGTGGHVVQTVSAALGTLLTAKNFEMAVFDTIRAGGDTDTVAAITGALWGTVSPIPERWLAGLHAETRSQAERLQRTILNA